MRNADIKDKFKPPNIGRRKFLHKTTITSLASTRLFPLYSPLFFFPTRAKAGLTTAATIAVISAIISLISFFSKRPNLSVDLALENIRLNKEILSQISSISAGIQYVLKDIETLRRELDEKLDENIQSLYIDAIGASISAYKRYQREIEECNNQPNCSSRPELSKNILNDAFLELLKARYKLMNRPISALGTMGIVLASNYELGLMGELGGDKSTVKVILEEYEIYYKNVLDHNVKDSLISQKLAKEEKRQKHLEIALNTDVGNITQNKTGDYYHYCVSGTYYKRERFDNGELCDYDKPSGPGSIDGVTLLGKFFNFFISPTQACWVEGEVPYTKRFFRNLKISEYSKNYSDDGIDVNVPQLSSSTSETDYFDWRNSSGRQPIVPTHEGCSIVTKGEFGKMKFKWDENNSTLWRGPGSVKIKEVDYHKWKTNIEQANALAYQITFLDLTIKLIEKAQQSNKRLIDKLDGNYETIIDR